ncbi:MAG TPA: hypothetical protein VF195_12210 [Actinomycetota bacterium]
MCYAHLKNRAMRGGALTEDEMEFVGTTVHWRDTGGGWRQPDTAAYEIGSILSAEDAALLQSLMNAGSTDRVEFLGG